MYGSEKEKEKISEGSSLVSYFLGGGASVILGYSHNQKVVVKEILPLFFIQLRMR